MFFDGEKTEIKRFHLNPLTGNYGVHIPRGRWHSLEVIESAVIYEVKDGTYTPLLKEDSLFSLQFFKIEG